jgi:AbrB family looped-hinge helix DNA binding protein
MYGETNMPKTIQASVTSQGQVTIPAEIRKQLGIGKPGKIAFVIDGDDIRLRVPRLTLEDVRASIPGIPGTSEDLDDEIEAAQMEEIKRLFVPRDAL